MAFPGHHYKRRPPYHSVHAYTAFIPPSALLPLPRPGSVGFWESTGVLAGRRGQTCGIFGIAFTWITDV